VVCPSRFGTQPGSEPGRVRTFRVYDPDLEPADPLPLVEDATGVSAEGVGA